ncbi:DUF1415 domain-containing protein [Ferrimonas sp. YFM]|uniref:DUF1415 domain-containing protein n=1 Tax=Ferrimonas sp. YFM TaxID=3028878 RepID=UPI002572F2F7|nr:DUF1415 domain-containing protein [Ferrimonas sp. YFM]BDY04849.1 DUF1415 domain-containing protein [Ferrimonas sp. YFM]
MKEHIALSQTRAWVERVIMKYNLCPFARREVEADSIRYAGIDAAELPRALEALFLECQYLDGHPEVATTLCVLTGGFSEFDHYLELVELATSLLQMQGYDGVYQLASFHPDYCFAGEPEDDPANFTNRSPWPTIHLIREESMARALAEYEDPEGIPERNVAFARKRGSEFFLSLLAGIKKQ